MSHPQPQLVTRLSRTVWLPIIIFISLSGLYLWVVPLGESPDEPGHLVCIDQVARLNRLPVVDLSAEEDVWTGRSRLISGRVCYHMPLYYLVAGVLQAGVTAVTNDPLPIHFPPNNENFFVTEPNAFIHESTSQPANILTIRILSIAFGCFVVYATWKISHNIWENQPAKAIYASLLVATWPQFIFASRSINNDSLAIALAVAILLTLSRPPPSPKRFLVATTLSSLALLTKLSVSFTIIVILLVFIQEIRTQKEQWQLYAKIGGICLLIWGATLTLMMLHPILSQHLAISGVVSQIPERVWTISYWQDIAMLTASSGWGRFGWMNVPLPMWHVWLWWGTVIFVSILAIPSLIKKQPKIFFLITIWIAGLVATYVRINLTVYQPQFRFLFPILPVLAILMVEGTTQCYNLLFSKRGGIFNKKKAIITLATIILSTSLIIYNIWVVTATLYPTYWQ